MTKFVIFDIVGSDERRAINPDHVINVVEDKSTNRAGPTCVIRMVTNGVGGIEARRVEGTLEDVVNRLKAGR